MQLFKDAEGRINWPEILTIVLVVGIISTLAAVAVNTARSKQRDATRLSQVRQLQSALEDHFGNANTYPVGDGLPLGDAAVSACLAGGGFAGDCTGEQDIYLRVVRGTVDIGLQGLNACGTPARNAFCYTQRRGGDDYVIQFELENALSETGLVKGLNCATPQGMIGGACR